MFFCWNNYTSLGEKKNKLLVQRLNFSASILYYLLTSVFLKPVDLKAQWNLQLFTSTFGKLKQCCIDFSVSVCCLRLIKYCYLKILIVVLCLLCKLLWASVRPKVLIDWLIALKPTFRQCPSSVEQPMLFRKDWNSFRSSV